MTPREVINPGARSPYRRYNKKPFQYSGTLNALAAARKAGDHHEAERLARQHSAAHGMQTRFALHEIPLEDV